MIEARCEHSDLVGTRHPDRVRVVALFDSPRGVDQLAERVRDVERDRKAADDRRDEAERGENE